MKGAARWGMRANLLPDTALAARLFNALRALPSDGVGSQNRHGDMQMPDFDAACAVMTRWAAEACG